MDKKKIAVAVANEANVDWTVGRADGTFIAYQSYFYSFGNTDKKFAEKLGKVLGIKVLRSGDEWRAWPKLSAFWVQFEVTDEKALCEKVDKFLAENPGCTKQSLYDEIKENASPVNQWPKPHIY